MYFRLIGERLKGMMWSPMAGWLQMRKESGYALETLILLFLCCVVIGLSSLFSGNDVSWAPETFIFFSTYLLLSVAMRAISPKMRKVNWEGSLNLLVYSSVPLFLAYSAGMLLGYKLYLLPTGIMLALLLFGLGLKQMLSISWTYCLVYTFCSFAAMLICMYWARVILSF